MINTKIIQSLLESESTMYGVGPPMNVPIFNDLDITYPDAPLEPLVRMESRSESYMKLTFLEWYTNDNTDTIELYVILFFMISKKSFGKDGLFFRCFNLNVAFRLLEITTLLMGTARSLGTEKLESIEDLALSTPVKP